MCIVPDVTGLFYPNPAVFRLPFNVVFGIVGSRVVSACLKVHIFVMQFSSEYVPQNPHKVSIRLENQDHWKRVTQQKIDSLFGDS